MTRHLAPLVSVLVAAAVLAGCGSEEPASAPEPSEASSSSSPSPTPSESESESASPSTGPQQCEAESEYTLTIFSGSIDCATASQIAAQLDDQGEKRQEVEGYVCEYGNAMTRPTIFSCTNVDQGADFAADEN